MSIGRIALVTPVRDEEKYIAGMIESIANQAVRPAKWIIVDDGSTDATAAIVESYSRDHEFIKLIKLPVRSAREPGGENAISHGLNCLKVSDYDFVARFDADLRFEPDYLACMLEKFGADPLLGIAGGGLYIEKDGGLQPELAPEYHVRGALKMYRRECFEELGGLSTQIGWDTIDEVTAWTKGWTTRSFFDCRVIHRRPTGHGLNARRVYWERGKAEYLTWSHPLFVAAKTLKLAVGTAGAVPAVYFICGFAWSYVRRYSRLADLNFVRARRSQQWSRVRTAVSSNGAGHPTLRAKNGVAGLDVRDGQ